MKFLVALILCLSAIAANPVAKRTAIKHSSIDSRISFGQLARRGEVPYSVAIWISFGPDSFPGLCAGAVIAEEWIITSAVCIDPGAVRLEVIAGSTYISSGFDDPDRQWINSTEAYIPEDFDLDSLQNNLGLIKLPIALTYTETVQPVGLAAEFIAAGVTGTISGFGYDLDDAWLYTYRLFFGDVVVIDSQDCQSAGHFPIYESQLCATPPASHPTAFCGGDGGAPLVADAHTDNPIIIGIAAFYVTTSSCEAGAPQGYSRVSVARDWIQETTGI